MSIISSLATQKLSELRRDILLGAVEDVYRFSMIVGDVEEILHSETREVVLAETMRIVSDLLKAGFLEPADLGEGAVTFVPWGVSVEKALSRLRRRWVEDETSETPDFIAWFLATPKAHEWSRRYEHLVSELGNSG